MENASKALMMAGAVLLGILLVSIFIYVYANSSMFSSNFEEQQNEIQLQEFNAQYEKYANRKDLTAQDIVSVANMAINNNQKGERLAINVYVNSGVIGYSGNFETKNEQYFYQFINAYNQRNTPSSPVKFKGSIPAGAYQDGQLVKIRFDIL